LSRHDGSPSQLLLSIYSEHEWHIFRFENQPREYWNKIENRKDFLDWLANDLGFKEMDDWYRLRKENIETTHGGHNLLTHYRGSIPQLLLSVYPQHKWRFSF
jgi:hypothetical protein